MAQPPSEESSLKLSDPREPDFLIHQESPLRAFWGRLKEVFRPEKQPDLVLESKPIPVKSIWAPPKPLRSRLGSVAVHALVLGVLALPFWRPVQQQMHKVIEATQIFIPPKIEPPMPKMRRLAGGGSPVPKPEIKIVQAPKIQPVTAPNMVVPLKETVALPSFGNLGPIAGPPGAGGGANGGNNGLGAGTGGGNCVGPNCGFGVAVESPIPIYQPEPEYTEAARKAKFQGTCEVQVTVGVDGAVTDPLVVQPLGLGLDEKAVQTVLKWRFQPARDKNGKAIAVRVNIDVNFHLY